ncbi:UNVERIFIED_ORG: hypothetical protein FHR35_009165 [Microbispora rosea subsp. rosea]
MPFDDVKVGDFATYRPLLAAPTLLAEVVEVSLPQAWRGGRRLVTLVALEDHATRDWRRGHELTTAWDDDAELNPAPASTHMGLALVAEPAWAVFKGGRPWHWYNYGPAWIPEALHEALKPVPISPRVFRCADLAGQYLETCGEGEPGDTIEQVQVKTWRSEYLPTPNAARHVQYVRALIVGPEVPTC